MFILCALVFGLLSLHAQVVFGGQFIVTFPDGVEQCEPVSVSFAGNTSQRVVPPMTLTVLPFNSTPIFIPIANAAAAPEGLSVTFLPLAAGTNFVASLDDSSRGNIARVSDVIRVLPSPSGNDSCLSTSTEEGTNANSNATPFQIDGTLSQCEDMTVKYDTTVVNSAPRVRIFDPKGPSFALNVTSDDSSNGIATYKVSVLRGIEIVLLIDDGKVFKTTSLLTVAGDSSSSLDCIVKGNGNSGTPDAGSVMMGDMNNVPNPGISRSVIIGASVGGGLIFFLIIAMLLFVFRERRRKREEEIQFDAANVERGEKPPARISVGPDVTASSTLPEGAVANPVYTFERFFTPSSGTPPRNSLASWSQNIPEDQKTVRSKQNSLSSIPSMRSQREQNYTSERVSINSLDIEGMLNMATVQSEKFSRQSSTRGSIPLSPMLAPQSSQFLSVPAPTVVRSYPSRGHLRSPSDVPADPIASPTLSNFSVDPFSDENVIADSSPVLRSFNMRSPLSALQTSAFIGLPSTPHGGPRFSTASADSRNIKIREAGSPRRSSRGTVNGDNYGIAQ